MPIPIAEGSRWSARFAEILNGGNSAWLDTLCPYLTGEYTASRMLFSYVCTRARKCFFWNPTFVAPENIRFFSLAENETRPRDLGPDGRRNLRVQLESKLVGTSLSDNIQSASERILRKASAAIVAPPESNEAPPLGRESEITQIETLLHGGMGPAHIRVCGPVGTGKSALVRAVWSRVQKLGKYDAMIWLPLKQGELRYPPDPTNIPFSDAGERRKFLQESFNQRYDLQIVGVALDVADPHFHLEFVSRYPRTLWVVDDATTGALLELPIFDRSDVILITPYIDPADKEDDNVINLEIASSALRAVAFAIFKRGARGMPLTDVDRELLTAYAERIKWNPLALLRAGRLRAKGVKVSEILKRSYDDRTFDGEKPDVGSYRARLIEMVHSLRKQHGDEFYSVLRVAAHFDPTGIPLAIVQRGIASQNPSVAGKSAADLIDIFVIRRLAERAALTTSEDLAMIHFATYFARTIRRVVAEDERQDGVGRDLNAAVQILKSLLRNHGQQAWRDVVADHRPEWLMKNLAVVVDRCFEIKLPQCADVSRLVRALAFSQRQSRVDAPFRSAALQEEAALLLNHEKYLAALSPTGRNESPVLLREIARLNDEWSAHYSARFDLANAMNKRDEAKEYASRALHYASAAVRCAEISFGVGEWGTLNLRRWHICAELHANPAIKRIRELRKSIDEVMELRRKQLGTATSLEDLSPRMLLRHCWSVFVEEVSSPEKGMHHVSQDFLVRAKINEMLGNFDDANNDFETTLSFSKALRKIYPFDYWLALACYHSHLAAHAGRKARTRESLAHEAFELKRSPHHAWLYSRVANVQQLEKLLPTPY
jgi:hypothetical protein